MNHDDEYHGDINYGNMYPKDWFWMSEIAKGLDDDPDAENEFSDFMEESNAK
tara:strand:- start:233 stop:388 length:156 start_codon:yes stop_codon:yes gene_type:complete